MMAIEDDSDAPLSVPGESADDLTATNIPDPLANEQTWPTEEEMEGGSGPSRLGGEDGVRTKRVPKGTSAYQAAWIIGEDGAAADDDDDDEEEDGEDMDGVDGDSGLGEDGTGILGEETEEIELDSRRSEIHRDLDPEQEERE